MNNRIKVILSLCFWLSAIHAVNHLSHGALLRFGIRPGQLDSLPYIFTAPFIHGGWPHLLNNLVGLAVFSALCLIRGQPFYLKSSALIIAITGALVWLFARPATHIGASGWIFGLWSLSMAIAWFQRSFINILVAVFVAAFYGGMIVGVLPGEAYVSFESHLFGAIAGVITAFLMTRTRARRRLGQTQRG